MLCKLTLLLTIAALASGCALFKKHPKPRAASAVPRLVGTVAIVDENQHFVLIDTDYSRILESGLVLTTYTGEIVSGTLRLSPERRRPFFAADIVSGDPKKGDRVVQPAPVANDSAPSSSVSSALTPAPSG